MRNFHHIFPLIAVLLISSCNSDDSISPDQLAQDSVIVAWLDTLNISANKTGNGIYYFAETTNPTGTAVTQAGSVLAFYFSLMDLDSNQIASHQPANGDSMLYKYASNAIFPVGIDEAIGVMREGEVYNFIIPTNLAYQDAPSISTSDGTGIVLLQINLVGIFSEAQTNQIELDQIDDFIFSNNLNDTVQVTIDRIDTTFLGTQILTIDTTFRYDIDSVEYFGSGVRYKEITPGTGNAPQNGDTLEINYSVEYLDGTQVFSQSNFLYELGSGIPDFLIPGFEFGLGLMPPLEEAIIMIPSAQAYRESARIVPSFITPELIDAQIIPEYVARVEPYKPLVFRVTRIQ